MKEKYIEILLSQYKTEDDLYTVSCDCALIKNGNIEEALKKIINIDILQNYNVNNIDYNDFIKTISNIIIENGEIFCADIFDELGYKGDFICSELPLVIQYKIINDE